MDNEIKKCSLCKHWTGKQEGTFRTCHKEFDNGKKFYMGYRILPMNMDSDGIIIECDEGWGCFCGPDFYCAHFEDVVGT